MDAVGVIGLGLMGGALAGRFRAAGLRVVGYDPRPAALEAFSAIGGEPRGSARDVFASTPVIVFSLPNSDVVAAVIAEAGPLGGKRVIDTTTGDPGATTALGAELAARGCEYLDATLTGSSREAREGMVVVTAGGDADVFRRSEPLFAMFAKAWFHVGPCGSGARTKLVVNLVLGLNRAVLAEGLAFAKRAGLDPAAVLEVLRSGSAYSRVMDTKGRKMLDAEFTPDAKLAQHLKDVRLILSEANRAGATTPLSALHERLLSALVAQGHGESDNSCVIRAFEGRSDP